MYDSERFINNLIYICLKKLRFNVNNHNFDYRKDSIRQVQDPTYILKEGDT